MLSATIISNVDALELKTEYYFNLLYMLFTEVDA